MKGINKVGSPYTHLLDRVQSTILAPSYFSAAEYELYPR